MKIRVALGWLSILVVMLAVAGCKSSTAGNSGAPTISTQPTNQTVTVGQTATVFGDRNRRRNADLPVV